MGKGASEQYLIESVVLKYPNVSAGEVSDKFAEMERIGLIFKRSKLSDARRSELAGVQVDNIDIHFHESLHESGAIAALKLLFSTFCGSISAVASSAQAQVVIYGPGHTVKDEKAIRVLVSSECPRKNQIDKADIVISSAKACISNEAPKWLRLDNAFFDTDADVSALFNVQDNGFDLERLAARLRRIVLGENTIPTTAAQLPKKPRLTIGMATFDDYDGTYFSLLSLLLYHQKVFLESEVIILDNNPDGAAAPHLKQLADHIKNVRYVPYPDKQGTAVRDVIFNLAQGEWVLCMDCHVMYPPNVLDRLVEYMEQNPQSRDLLQGPLLSDSGEVSGTHFEEHWREGMYGYWEKDNRGVEMDAEPFEIPMQGLGMFVCRKSAWLSFNKLFRHFGGEEGYIHQKFRNAGAKCLCLPFLRWSHRFARPAGVNYQIDWISRIENYLIGFAEVGLDVDLVESHFSEFLNQEIVDEANQKVLEKKRNPFSMFEHSVCINTHPNSDAWVKMQQRFDCLKIGSRIQQWSAVSTPEFPEIGETLTQRKLISRANDFGYESLLVFKDDTLMLSGADMFLSLTLTDLGRQDWNVLHLSGMRHRYAFDDAPIRSEARALDRGQIACLNVVAYHRSAYGKLLEALPSTEDEMANWLTEHGSLEEYLSQALDKRYLISPNVFSKSELTGQQEEPYKHHFM